MSINSKKEKIYAFLDKDSPPSHSFVDGMLASLLPNKNIDVYLIVSRSKRKEKKYQYKNAICLPILFKRKGIRRFLNYFTVKKIIKKVEKTHGNHIRNIIVRNEPIYLLAASKSKKRYNKLFYQQSFPHEVHERKIDFKKDVAKYMIRK